MRPLTSLTAGLLRVAGRALALAAAAALPLAVAQEAPAADLHFASMGQARAALSADDEWTATAGAFQRAAALGVSATPSVPEFRASLAGAAVECPAAFQQRWRTAWSAMLPRLTALGVRPPAGLQVVCTNGSDSANAPYTRGKAIFLPTALSMPGYSDSELLAHELFHIITRHDPALATRVYRLFSFEPVGPLEWPAEWAIARISNPDAPHHRHAMRIETPNGDVHVMPVLVARRTQLQPGETFFSVLDVRLLAVEPGREGQPSRPVRRDGQLLWQPAQAVPPYLRALGGNTGYIFHAEETAADNFAFLVSGRQVANPQLLVQLEKALATPAADINHQPKN